MGFLTHSTREEKSCIWFELLFNKLLFIENTGHEFTNICVSLSQLNN